MRTLPALLALLALPGALALGGCISAPTSDDDDVADDDDDTGDDDDDTGDDDDDTGDDDDDTGDDDDDSGDDDDDDSSAELTPLYGPETPLEAPVVYDRGDAIVTHIADRARDRHAREDEFQSYDHYLPFYWEYRMARVRLVDTVAHGGSTIELSVVTEWPLTVAEFRGWYLGLGTVATYAGNYAGLVETDGPGTYDDDHVRVSDDGTQHRYTLLIDYAMPLSEPHGPLALGQHMELELSQFLAGVPRGRANYYGTAMLYEVGVGGVLPWEALGDIADPGSRREDAAPLAEAGWLGGRTTLPYNYSDEPHRGFMQMATHTAGRNGQPFVRGRRVHHTDMRTGRHDENDENGVFSDLVSLAGVRSISTSCNSCHTRNGRAPAPQPGDALGQHVFQVGDASGAPHPLLGRVLQPAGSEAEGGVTLAAWLEGEDGLRRPEYAFAATEPDQFSARISPQLVGMGLLDAIDEAHVLDWEDPADADGDGISGRAQRVEDPSGALRLGRFGWKAGATSLELQVAGALNTDMGVMTALRPEPDCGSAQEDCAPGPQLDPQHLDDLVRYVALLGVPARRDLTDPEALAGEMIFDELGCDSCHRPSYTTSPYHPLAELRSQTIQPYTDLLLHDMGPGLADSLAEGAASGAEWRTPPLWGLGHGPCVTGGVEGPFPNQVCAPDASYLHDGRARTLSEAILWHGGEAEAARAGFEALTEEEQAALVAFLESL